jgi:hypothetical protein
MDGRIDEMGTLESPMDAYGREVAARVVEQQKLQTLNDEVLEIHGVQTGKKPDGVVCLVYKNANGIDGRFKNNWKVEKAKEIYNDLEVDIAAYNKLRLNMQYKLNKVGFNQLFWEGEAEVCSVVAHNGHGEKKQRVQEGGTSMLMFGKLIDYFNSSHSGREESGWGRWVVMMLKEETTTRIILWIQTMWQQQAKLWHGISSITTVLDLKTWLSHLSQSEVQGGSGRAVAKMEGTRRQTDSVFECQ